MFPHPDTVCAMSTLDYQERLREAAIERIAAGAQPGSRSPLADPWAARLVVASWLSGIVRRVHGAKQTPVSSSLVSIEAQPERQGA